MVSTPTRFSKVLGTDSLLLTHLAGFAVDTTFPGVWATPCSTLTEIAVRHQAARQVCSDQLASQCLSSCLPVSIIFYCQVQPLSLLINNLLDGRGQLLPWGGEEEPHCIPWAVPGSPGQDFLLAPSLLVPVSVTVEWSHSSVCPGTLHLVSRYSTGNDFQSKLLWVAKPVKWPGELCQCLPPSQQPACGTQVQDCNNDPQEEHIGHGGEIRKHDQYRVRVDRLDQTTSENACSCSTGRKLSNTPSHLFLWFVFILKILVKLTWHDEENLEHNWLHIRERERNT